MLGQELISGFEGIDCDHDKMLQEATRLVSSSPEDRSMILSHLIDYITDHCVAEERLMRTYHYALMEQHSLLHRDMQDDMVRAFKDIMVAQARTPILHNIRQNIHDHIFIHDKEFVLFLQREGITSSKDL